MQQHPVPQQISAYHFRLVGDMTIKQFLELAGGIVVGWIIYSLPVPSLIRWPLVIFSVFFGIALAFLPLEERPLDRWIIAFLKAVYSPTQYVWSKTPVTPAFFEKIKIKPLKAGEEARTSPDRKRLKEYLETLPAQGPQTALDKKEAGFVSSIMRLYKDVQPKTIKPVKLKTELLEEEAMPKVAVRKLKTPPMDPRAIMRGEIILPKRKPKKVKIPQAEPIEVEKTSPDLAAPPEPQPEQIKEASPTESSAPAKAIKIPSMKPVHEAAASSEIPMPAPPTDPNVISGMVLDSEGNIVDNAIITIRDDEGKVARAQKTNKIGQFFIATPLDNGEYQIDVEREGLSFDIIKIELAGEPVPPVEIRAQ